MASTVAFGESDSRRESEVSSTDVLAEDRHLWGVSYVIDASLSRCFHQVENIECKDEKISSLQVLYGEGSTSDAH